MIKTRVEADSFLSLMKSLKQTTKNLRPAFDDFGKWIKKETHEQFEKEVDPDGKPWEPLAPSTLKKKKTTFKLRETMFMYNAVYYVANDKFFTLGIKDDKYKFHHTGTSRMPARVVIGITQERRGKLNGFVTAQIRRVKGLRKKRSSK